MRHMTLSQTRSNLFHMSLQVRFARHCDMVLVLDGGRLVDRGTHTDLVARPGLYRDTWMVQSQRAAAEGDEVAS